MSWPIFIHTLPKFHSMTHKFNPTIICTALNTSLILENKYLSTSPPPLGIFFNIQDLIKKVCQPTYTHAIQALPNFNGNCITSYGYPIFILLNGSFASVILLFLTNLWFLSSIGLLNSLQSLVSLPLKGLSKLIFHLSLISSFFTNTLFDLQSNALDTIQVSCFHFLHSQLTI